MAAIHDSGHGLDDPFAGYGPAHGEDLSHGGMGLWLARQLCDHVAIIVNGQVLYSHGEAQSVMPGRVLRGNVER